MITVFLFCVLRATAQAGLEERGFDQSPVLLSPEVPSLCDSNCTLYLSELDCSTNRTGTCACFVLYGFGNETCARCGGAAVCVDGTTSTSLGHMPVATTATFPTLIPQCHNICSRIAGYAVCTNTAPYVCLCSVLLEDGPACSHCLESISPKAASGIGNSLAICSTLPPCPSPCTGPFITLTNLSTTRVFYPTESISLSIISLPTFANTTPKPAISTTTSGPVQTARSRGQKISIIEDSVVAFWIMTLSSLAVLVFM